MSANLENEKDQAFINRNDRQIPVFGESFAKMITMKVFLQGLRGVKFYELQFKGNF